MIDTPSMPLLCNGTKPVMVFHPLDGSLTNRTICPTARIVIPLDEWLTARNSYTLFDQQHREKFPSTEWFIKITFPQWMQFPTSEYTTSYFIVDSENVNFAQQQVTLNLKSAIALLEKDIVYSSPYGDGTDYIGRTRKVTNQGSTPAWVKFAQAGTDINNITFKQACEWIISDQRGKLHLRDDSLVTPWGFAPFNLYPYNYAYDTQMIGWEPNFDTCYSILEQWQSMNSFNYVIIPQFHDEEWLIYPEEIPVGRTIWRLGEEAITASVTVDNSEYYNDIFAENKDVGTNEPDAYSSYHRSTLCHVLYNKPTTWESAQAEAEVLYNKYSRRQESVTVSGMHPGALDQQHLNIHRYDLRIGMPFSLVGAVIDSYNSQGNRVKEIERYDSDGYNRIEEVTYQSLWTEPGKVTIRAGTSHRTLEKELAKIRQKQSDANKFSQSVTGR